MSATASFDPEALTTVTYELDHGVATVTLNRPESLNSFTETMCDEIASVWQHVRFCADVRCVILTGAGSKAFCTGIDRGEIPLDAEYDGLVYDDPGRRLGARAQECWKPIIGAVNGMACGGAFYLLGDVDFIVAAEHATFFDPHVTYGMAAVFEPSVLLHRMHVGELSRLMLLGAHERLSAATACEVGLVSEVVPADELMPAARRLAATIASQPAYAVQATVRALWAARNLARGQMLQAGNAFLAMGTRSSQLEAGQATFSSGTRITPRIR